MLSSEKQQIFETNFKKFFGKISAPFMCPAIKGCLIAYSLPVEHILQNISSHTQGFKPYFFGVAVYRLVFPAITKIRFIAVKQYQPAFVDDAKALWWLAVMFMDLGQTFGKRKGLMVDGV